MVKGQRLAKFVQTLFVLLLAVVVFSGTAAAAQTNLPDGFIIVDSDGVHVKAEGAYVIYADNLIPGETLTKTLTIHNMERGDKPFALSMTAEPEEVSGPVDLLDIITLTITMDGKTLYHGRLRGDEGFDMTQKALELGTYAEGDTQTLEIVLQVGNFDLNVDHFNPQTGKSTADISWQFYAVKDETVKPPLTGVIVKYSLYVFGVLVCLSALVLLFLTKKRKKDEEQPKLQAQEQTS